MQFNPVDQADNLRKYGGYIPGIRPGPPTAQYLDRVLTRLTLPGSLFLAAVAVLPSIFINYFGFSQATSRALGGTSVLIVVGVALDTMRQMESQMMMRSYEGFLRVNLLVLGPQGAGKGTQAKRIARSTAIPHVSTGDMFRARDRRRHASSASRSSRSWRAGELVPDEITIALIRERLGEPDARGGLRPRRLSAQPGAGGSARRDARRASAAASTRFSSSTFPTRSRTARMLEARRGGGPPRRHARRDRQAARDLPRETEPIVEHYRVTGRLVPLHAERTIDEVWAEIQDALAELEEAA